MTTFTTSIDVASATRASMIALLNQQLADMFDLQSQLKQAHWNVKGPNFLELHETFDEFAAEISEFVDTIAERVTAFGGTAMGTVRMAASRSTLPECPMVLGDGTKAVEIMAARYSKVCASTRAAIDAADEAGDKGTADLFTGISRSLDKSLWFLEAQLQVK